LGESLNSAATAYSFVYHIEIYMLFVVLIALGPLVRQHNQESSQGSRQSFGLAEFPS
jgi:BCD family chlorophyll transporter-like MFS transporter